MSNKPVKGWFNRPIRHFKLKHQLIFNRQIESFTNKNGPRIAPWETPYVMYSAYVWQTLSNEDRTCGYSELLARNKTLWHSVYDLNVTTWYCLANMCDKVKGLFEV